MIMTVDPDSNEPTIDLLLRAQSGDAEALNVLLERYLPRLNRWASGRLPTGLRSMLDTGDLVQEAVINALRNLNSLEIRHEGTLQTYLRRAVKNRIIDLYRRSARRPARDELRSDAMSAAPSPFEIAVGAETADWYERALARLTDDDQTLIFLSVELGLTAREIAAETGRPSADAARMAVSRAIDKLAGEMKQLRH